MKTRPALAAAALAILALTGCGGQAQPATVTVTATPAPAPTITPAQLFLTQVHQHTTTLDQNPDSQFLDVADKTCKALDAGATYAQLDKVIQGATPIEQWQDWYKVSAYGIQAFCPEHLDEAQ